MFPSLLAAFRFLTVLPVPGSPDNKDTTLAKSPLFFPLVGLVIGAIGALLVFLIWNILPIQVAAVLLVLYLVVISGGLHMDGLADTADGFFSSRSREQILIIMRDSRIGAMGVMAIVLILALKIMALGSMDRSTAIRALFLMPIAGRTAILLLMALLDYVRVDGGLGTLFYSLNTKKFAFAGCFFYIVFSLLVAGGRGWILTSCFLLSMYLFSYMCKRKINGATGDTLGAGAELAETVVALVLSLK